MVIKQSFLWVQQDWEIEPVSDIFETVITARDSRVWHPTASEVVSWKPSFQRTFSFAIKWHIFSIKGNYHKASSRYHLRFRITKNQRFQPWTSTFSRIDNKLTTRLERPSSWRLWQLERQAARVLDEPVTKYDDCYPWRVGAIEYSGSHNSTRKPRMRDCDI